MKSALVLLSVLAVATAKLEFCSQATGENFENVEVSYKPDPIVVQQGAMVEFHVGFDMKKTLEVGSTVTMQLTKEGVVPITLPCIPVEGLSIPLGSCVYVIQDLLDAVEADGYCKPSYFPNGCDLPFAPGHYGGDKNEFISFKLPDIPAVLAPILKGTISFKATLFNKGAEEVACVTGELHFA